MPKKVPADERLESFILKDQSTGCWNYTGAQDRKGYGIFRYSGKKHRAHRASYMMFKGPIEDGHVVMHLCDNPSCVNPNHLRTGTQQENVTDMYRKNRENIAIGDRHGSSKLNRDQVQFIRESTIRTGLLAERYGVSRHTIQKIRSGINWSKVN